MKFIKSGLSALIICTAGPGMALADAATDARVTEARAIIKEFAGNLKGTLVKEMKAHGPVSALQVCNVEAPDITLNSSEKSAWNVARTSLRLRNPGNEPDDWERNVLNMFEDQKSTGADPKKLEFFEYTQVDGEQVFRYMKAIPTGKPCLACHGGDLKPAVAEKIAELYPDDAARGFALGDIRGAFTLTQSLE